MALSAKSFADELRIEGITFKGFGVIPKAVTLDPKLSIEAKAIYAYFASFSGGGNCAFPSRDKILSDLQISKDRYYRHFNKLVEKGLLTVKKDEGKGFTKNIYILKSASEDNSAAPGSVVMSGIKSAGYGIIPKAVTIDTRLSIEAKGLYAYYAAFTGAGHECMPKRDDILYHLNISRVRYGKYRDMLEEFGYIEVSRLHENGLLSNMRITLLDHPEFVSGKKRTVTVIKKAPDQQSQNKDIGNHQESQNKDISEIHEYQAFEQVPVDQRSQNKDIVHQQSQNQDAQNQDAQNKDTNNNNINNNSLNSNSFIKKREEKGKSKKSENEKSQNPSLPPYEFKSPVGSITISLEEKEKLEDSFADLTGLLELAICSLSQRSTMPKSTFHFIWELGINKRWPRAIKKTEGTGMNAEEKALKQWEEEEDQEFRKKVMAYMEKEGLTDYEKAAEEYAAKAEAQAREKINRLLGRN